MKKIVISVGPIPARLDSVKFVTNRFKGGLAIKTARMLQERGFEVSVVAWKFTDVPSDLKVIRVDDVVDYVGKMLGQEADAYILAAAVANLMPSSPYEGKFPSHKYRVGEKFNVEFEIAPRLIDQIKLKFPRAALVGYKLFDGELEELLEAARHTLDDSKANIVFANAPGWAKEKKWVLTQDGACFECSFDEHVNLIERLVGNQFYRTRVNESSMPKEKSEDLKKVLSLYPRTKEHGKTFGTFACKQGEGFWTTTRGKKNGEECVAYITSVDHEKMIVNANEKASLNAPLLDLFLKQNPEFVIAIHDHIEEGKKVVNDYQFPGTKGDNQYAVACAEGECLQLTHHGYLVGFRSIEALEDWLKNR